MTALDTVLATTPEGGDLQTADFNVVEERLKALFDDRKALDTLPERCSLERELDAAGFGELIADLHDRHVSVNAVRDELRLAWWTTVFDDIVHSSAIISNQDGSALQSASDRFIQVDSGSHGGPLCSTTSCTPRRSSRTKTVRRCKAPPTASSKWTPSMCARWVP